MRVFSLHELPSIYFWAFQYPPCIPTIQGAARASNSYHVKDRKKTFKKFFKFKSLPLKLLSRMLNQYQRHNFESHGF